MNNKQKIWVISPYGSKAAKNKSYQYKGKSFEDVWRYDLENNCIALGSAITADIRGFNPVAQTLESIKAEFISNCKNRYSHRQCVQRAKVSWIFYNEIKNRDFVVARQGAKIILGFGRVFSDDRGRLSFYDSKKGLERTGNNYNPHSNFLNIKWKENKIDFGICIFNRNRLMELNKSFYHKNLVEKYTRIITQRINKLWHDPDASEH